MLTGCMIFWNDLAMLKRSVPELRKRVDRLVMVDGPYAQFPKTANPLEYWPSDTLHSTDGSHALAVEYADSVVSGFWDTEEQKRCAYLEATKSGSNVIVVDADEVIDGELPFTMPELARIEVRRNDKSTPPYPVVRVFKHTPTLRYAGTHHTLFDGERFLNAEPMPTIKTAWLNHLVIEREADKARLQLKHLYYGWLQEHEGIFKAEMRRKGIQYEA